MPESTSNVNEAQNSNGQGTGESAASAGDSERPEWLPEQFWNAESARSADTPAQRLNLASVELAKSYSNLTGKLREKTDVLREEVRAELAPKAPEQYELGDAASYLPESFDAERLAEDPLFQWFTESARTNALSNEQYQGAMKGFFEILAKQAEESTERVESLLGKEAPQRIERLEQWLTANAKPELVEKVAPLLNEEPELVLALEGLRANVANRSYGSHGGNENLDTHMMTRTEIEEIQKTDAYWNPRHPAHSRVNEQVRKAYELLDKAGKL